MDKEKLKGYISIPGYLVGYALGAITRPVLLGFLSYAEKENNKMRMEHEELAEEAYKELIQEKQQEGVDLG